MPISSLRRALVLAAFYLMLLPAYADVLLNESEIAQVIRHGPWPPPKKTDPSNRVSGSKTAIALGKTLFSDARFSRNGKISCASCHDPARGWTDGKARAGGLARLDRNTQSLFNVAQNRWFGWDGRNDSLWAHSIGPILAEAEMGMTPDTFATQFRSDVVLSKLYAETFSRSPSEVEAPTLLVDSAKALAAFQETIVTSRTVFDRFRDALDKGDLRSAGTYPADAQRGLKLFVGRGKCNVCHIGPRFTNDEFDDAGVPYFTAPGRVDRGRHGGLRRLKKSPYNLLGQFNDAPQLATGWATRHVRQTHRTFGQFKVPSLRELTRTAPYMHNGSLATLADVARHYSDINLERMHSDNAAILQPLKMTRREIQDLVAFLRSLSTSTD